MQRPAHCGLAALATPVAAAPTPQTIVSVATAASTFLLINSTGVDVEVMTDLLSEDLTGCGRYTTKPARPLCSSRPYGPWSTPGAHLAGHVTRRSPSMPSAFATCVRFGEGRCAAESVATPCRVSGSRCRATPSPG